MFRKIVVEPCKHIWQKYETALYRQPLATKSLLSGFLFFSGDVLAQGIERKVLDKPAKTETTFGIEWDRAVQLTAFGVMLNGPALHYWYRYLDRSFGMGTGWKTVFKKVAADQFGFAPLFYVGFLGTMPLLQDTLNYDTLRWLQNKPPLHESKNGPSHLGVGATSLFRKSSVREMFNYEKNKFVHSVRTSFVSTLMMDYRIWPIANVINFGFVPAEQRVLFSSLVYIGYNAYLSAVVNGHSHGGEAVVETEDGGETSPSDRVESVTQKGNCEAQQTTTTTTTTTAASWE